MFNKQFIGVDKDAKNVVLATTTVPGESETFQIIRNSDNANRVKIKASNGFFLQVKSLIISFLPTFNLFSFLQVVFKTKF